MAKTIRDDLDRPSGRFVRSLALSVGGGALLTLLGATAAQAQDGGAAGTASDGAGAARSGDATAVGNRSGTTKTQTADASGTVGNLHVVNQTAAVGNVGVAVADTGRNVARGNTSENTTTANQTSVNALGGAVNNGTAANGSNGTATISTGNASAVGNQSTTVIAQDSSTTGQLGNILIVQQGGLVANAGVALANTGGNTADGNTSVNEAGLLQEAAAAAGLASNSGTARNTSHGLATISTGNASATGNHSDTKVLQSANGSAGGDPGGLALIPQGAIVLNAGAAQANSGGNTATGHDSDNTNPAGLTQNIGDVAIPDGPVGVASNNGEVSNWSNGEANIRTGDAQAIGNESTTDVWQGHEAWIGPDGGVSIAPQLAAVVNLGAAQANSGGNTATGNISDNSATVTQDIPVSGGVDVGVAGNFGQAEASSDGTASIVTGDAYASGNRSKTDVEQNVLANGGFLNLQTQVALVGNVGLASANSGGNTATGNASDSDAFVDQEAILSSDPGIDLGVVGQFGKASSASDGTAAIETGTASAVGNDSETGVGQTEDPSGLVINTQVAAVLNAGAAQANSGGNTAIGNESGLNNANLTQDIEIGQGNPMGSSVLAGTIVAANNGEASNASDGLATISTGAAAATGNQSGTNVRQEANGAIDGQGIVLNTQLAPVVNVGLASANSGGNTAIGNTSTSDANVEQDVFIASDNAGVTDLVAGIVTASNNGTASNASDGEANITTGTAAAAGNQSQTVLAQNADGQIDGLGAVINTQLPLVVNAGLGVANSGGNQAVGNVSVNDATGADLDQAVEIASDNAGDTSLIAPFVTGTNSGSAENASDGTADIRTGGAQATGNASATHLTQDASGHAPGLVINTQLGGVLNAGAAVANSGGNFAFGNGSTNEAEADQDADILSENADTADLLAIGPVTASNQGTASSTSDGTAVVKTGGAQAQGNVSSTFFGQGTDNTVSGLGAGISTQVGGVANVGVGVANSGLNLAIGNASTNDAELEQNAEIASDNGAAVDLTVIGPVTASNSAEASNSSDGHAKVKTGGALATGNASATNLSQHQDDEVTGLGVVLGTQVGGVANVGVGVANSGLNLAIGNISENDIDSVGGGDEAFQDADVISDSGAPASPIVLLGGATAANELTASNTSDGEACVCTGDAVASGNVSSTTLIQDLNLTVGTGVIVLTEAGGVLNAGVGLANTGLNAAIGNSSENDAQLTQTSDINDALVGLPIALAQTAHNGGEATNTSDGTALVASGNASGTGNQSTTDFVQAASVDADFAVSALVGGTANAGLGLANSGLNFGLGNDSTNLAVLDQAADGSGIVSNQGEAANESDGTAIIGNPEDCEDEVVTPPTQEEDKPGAPGLPRTGAELETQAAVALMLLLLGFGLQRRSRRMA